MRSFLPLLLPFALLSAEPTPAPAWLGVHLNEVDEALSYHLNLSGDLGVLVEEVVPGSPGAAMGLKTWDIIVAVDGKPVYTPRALQAEIRERKPGDAVALTLRRGAQSVDVKGALAPRPPESERPPMACGEGPTPRRGQVRQPDGSIMEWSIGEQPPIGGDTKP